MTERDPTPVASAGSDRLAELRRILDHVAQAEKLLIDATRGLDAMATPITPPHPPPPPPWREVLTRLEVVIESCVATSLRARRDVLLLEQQVKGDATRG